MTALVGRVSGRSPIRDGLALGLVAFIIVSYVAGFVLGGQVGRDFVVCQGEVQAWLAGAPIYPAFEVQGQFQGSVFGLILYPPATTVLFALSLRAIRMCGLRLRSRWQSTGDPRPRVRAGGLLYSFQDLTLLAVPLVAWASSTRGAPAAAGLPATILGAGERAGRSAAWPRWLRESGATSASSSPERRA